MHVTAIIAARRITRWTLLLGVPLVAIATGLYLYARGGNLVDTENAYVKADIVAVGAEIAGRVIEVRVQDNQAVAKGELLATLAFSEAGSRSHFWAPLSTARKEGDAVVLEAEKSWVTSASQADLYVWSSKPLAWIT